MKKLLSIDTSEWTKYGGSINFLQCPKYEKIVSSFLKKELLILPVIEPEPGKHSVIIDSVTWEDIPRCHIVFFGRVIKIENDSGKTEETEKYIAAHVNEDGWGYYHELRRKK